MIDRYGINTKNVNSLDMVPFKINVLNFGGEKDDFVLSSFITLPFRKGYTTMSSINGNDVTNKR